MALHHGHKSSCAPRQPSSLPDIQPFSYGFGQHPFQSYFDDPFDVASCSCRRVPCATRDGLLHCLCSGESRDISHDIETQALFNVGGLRTVTVTSVSGPSCSSRFNRCCSHQQRCCWHLQPLLRISFRCFPNLVETRWHSSKPHCCGHHGLGCAFTRQILTDHQTVVASSWRSSTKPTAGCEFGRWRYSPILERSRYDETLPNTFRFQPPRTTRSAAVDCVGRSAQTTSSGCACKPTSLRYMQSIWSFHFECKGQFHHEHVQLHAGQGNSGNSAVSFFFLTRALVTVAWKILR